MKAYIACILNNLRLTTRDRGALFFGYLFPLIFFFIFASFMHAERGGVILQVVTMVLIIGVLGNGFFGAGMRAVMEREANILRRYKVAPISAGPILAASLVTGWVNYMPSFILILVLSHFIYGMAVPEKLGSLVVFLSIGVVAFRAMGLIIASVVNSMQESQIVIQLLYMPMLFLSGATIPTSIMPQWVQIVAQFLPATHLFTGMQAILVKKESIWDNWTSAAALVLTTILATLLGIKLFRWEKEEKIAASGKMWLAAVLAPFIVLGGIQAYSKENLAKNKVLNREMRRGHTTLIRGARIFVGDGRVIDSGGVLIRGGKIAEVYAGATPDPKTLQAEPIEAAGKTLLPGLIDLHAHLGAPGGVPDAAAFSKSDPNEYMRRELAAYLYSGVTTVKSVGDSLAAMKAIAKDTTSGEYLGSAIIFAGPMFTAAGGHGTEYFKDMPENVRRMLEAETLRLPKTPAEARQQVAALKKEGVSGIKAILESGAGGRPFNRLDTAIFLAIGEEARAQGLPLAVHTGDNRDIADAIAAGAAIIEHGSARESVTQENLEKMANAGIAYDATLTVIDAFEQIREGKFTAFDRSLVQQAVPDDLLASTKKFFASPDGSAMRDRMRTFPMSSGIAIENMKRARAAGVTLAIGSDAGNMLVFHGPTVQRELQLYVEKAGIPPAEALMAATRNAARVLKADNRIGLIQPGFEANLLLVDGNPLTDIAATERISLVVFQGERVDRSELFGQK